MKAKIPAYGRIANISWTVAKSLKRGFVGIRDLIQKEAQIDFREEVPVIKRLYFHLHGFATSSGVLYDFERHSPAQYLSDFKMRRRKKANGNEQAFPTRKYPFHLLMERSHPDFLPELYGLIAGEEALSKEQNLINENAANWLLETVENLGQVVVKPEDGNGGEGVVLLSWKDGAVDIAGDAASIDELVAKSMDETYMVVEHIEQAPYSAEIYPESVNTIRVITLWDYEANKPYIADAIHRFGTNVSRPVDNWDSGGLSAGIDLESGELLQATRFPDSAAAKWFRTHPDTNIQIEGVTIPQWDEITDTCCEMAETFWYVPMNAWDIVVSEDGIKVIEGNSRPTIEMIQAHRPLFIDERNRQFFEYHDAL